jgi:hypothetical protein
MHEKLEEKQIFKKNVINTKKKIQKNKWENKEMLMQKRRGEESTV